MRTHFVVFSGLALFFVGLVGTLGFAPAVRADGGRAPQAGAIINVSTVADDFTNNGNCTLREAIQAANTNSAVDNCTAGTGADTIVLSRLTYKLTLSGGGECATCTNNSTADLDITSSVTLTPTVCLAVGGAPSSR